MKEDEEDSTEVDIEPEEDDQEKEEEEEEGVIGFVDEDPILNEVYDEKTASVEDLLDWVMLCTDDKMKKCLCLIFIQ